MVPSFAVSNNSAAGVCWVPTVRVLLDEVTPHKCSRRPALGFSSVINTTAEETDQADLVICLRSEVVSGTSNTLHRDVKYNFLQPKTFPCSVETFKNCT